MKGQWVCAGLAHSNVPASVCWCGTIVAVLVLVGLVSLVISTVAHTDGPTPPTDLNWDIQCVDCPKHFSDMSMRSLRLDATGLPHIVYGGDALYHAWHDGTSWRLETVDVSPWEGAPVGEDTSLALDSAGNPHIAYLYVGDLKYAYRTGSTWVIQTVDTDGWMSGLSLALDHTDSPHISYYDDNGTLRYAHRVGDSWSIQTVGDGGGGYTSLALDSAGNPHISYRHIRPVTQSDSELDYARPLGSLHRSPAVIPPPQISELRYARWTSSAWLIQVLESATGSSGYDGALGSFTSLALDSVGNPHISYTDFKGLLKYTRWTGNSWITGFVDSSAPGTYVSMVLDSAGNPHIGYVSQYIKYAHWTGNSWNIQIVDSIVGGHTSLALDNASKPHISYFDSTPDLKYAHWTGSAWGIQTLDRTGLAGRQTSLALDRAGNPHISYSTSSGGHEFLKYAHWTGGAWISQTVDSIDALSSTSLTLDGSGNPHIGYEDSGRFKYAHWTGNTWITQTVNSIGYVDEHISLALDSADNPHVSYYDIANHDLKYARWTGGTWDIQTVDKDSYGDVGYYSSLALDRAGNPHISYCAGYTCDYYYSYGTLRYAYWTGNAWVTQTVDSASGTGVHTSLALDSLGNPHITYFDSLNYAIKYARWMGSAWVTQTVDIRPNGTYRISSLKLDNSDNPHISYGDGPEYAHWTGSTWVIQTIERGWASDYPSLALDNLGNPHISFYAVGGGNLKYVTGAPKPPIAYQFAQDEFRAVEPGEQVVYVHTLQNMGTLTDTYNLTCGDSQNWSVFVGQAPSGTMILPASLILMSGQAAIFTVTVSIPNTDTVRGLMDTTIITATSTLSPTLVKRVTDTTLVPRARVYLPIILRN